MMSFRTRRRTGAPGGFISKQQPQYGIRLRVGPVIAFRDLGGFANMVPGHGGCSHMVRLEGKDESISRPSLPPPWPLNELSHVRASHQSVKYTGSPLTARSARARRVLLTLRARAASIMIGSVLDNVCCTGRYPPLEGPPSTAPVWTRRAGPLACARFCDAFYIHTYIHTGA